MANDLLTLNEITKEAIKRFKESPAFVNRSNLAEYYLQQGLLQQAIQLVTGKPASAGPTPPDRRSALEIMAKAREARARMEEEMERQKAFYEGSQWVLDPSDDKMKVVPGPRENEPPLEETVVYGGGRNVGKTLRLRVPDDVYDVGIEGGGPPVAPVPAPVLTMPSWPPRRELFFDEEESAPIEVVRLPPAYMITVAYGHMIFRPQSYGIVRQAR